MRSLCKASKGSAYIEYAFVLSFSAITAMGAVWSVQGTLTEAFKNLEAVQATVIEPVASPVLVLPPARMVPDEEVPVLIEERQPWEPNQPEQETEEPVIDPEDDYVALIDDEGNDLPIPPFIPAPEAPVCVEGYANPGNDKCVGRAGENPNGAEDWGTGSNGMSDGKPKGNKKP